MHLAERLKHEEVNVTCGVINSEEIPLDPKVFVFGL